MYETPKHARKRIYRKHTEHTHCRRRHDRFRRVSRIVVGASTNRRPQGKFPTPVHRFSCGLPGGGGRRVEFWVKREDLCQGRFQFDPLDRI